MRAVEEVSLNVIEHAFEPGRPATFDIVLLRGPGEVVVAVEDRGLPFDWKLLELPAVSPFSFAIYASVIKENMMLEDPTTAIERIYREMYAKVESAAASVRP